jgi:hypothetical protein
MLYLILVKLGCQKRGAGESYTALGCSRFVYPFPGTFPFVGRFQKALERLVNDFAPVMLRQVANRPLNQ